MNEREQSEARDQHKHSLQRLEERDDAHARRDLRDDALRDFRRVRLSFRHLHPPPPPRSSGIFNPFSRAVSSASSYPASTCRATPRPGSLVSTRLSRFDASALPSATETWPACRE